MKLKSLFYLLLSVSPAISFANWLNVGKVDYNWGPFHVYTISLYTETGTYQTDIRPLMLSLQYAKPVEGKNFAITLTKEIEGLKLPNIDTNAVLKTLTATLPDFHPNDILSYIALQDKGYFVLNDTILNTEFDATFNDAFVSIWLSPKGSFARLQSKLLGQADTKLPTAEAVAKLSSETQKAKTEKTTLESTVSENQVNDNQAETVENKEEQQEKSTENTKTETMEVDVQAIAEKSEKFVQEKNAQDKNTQQKNNSNPQEEKTEQKPAEQQSSSTEATPIESKKENTENTQSTTSGLTNKKKEEEKQPEQQEQKQENKKQEEPQKQEQQKLDKETQPDVIPPDQENADPELLQKPVVEKTA